jgi:mono/diheme cytochrome c family protein
VKLKLTLFITSVLLLIAACNQNSSDTTLTEEQSNQAKKLLETQCYTCHIPKGGPNERLAPPMFAVKKHYTKHYATQEEFVKAFSAYVTNPDSLKSKMPGALKRFGVMPKMTINEEDLHLIATYVYQNEFKKPSWYNKHEKGEKHRLQEATSGELNKAKGKEIALSTKAALGKNLMKAINLYGTAGAVDFCNTRALPITDSMANVHGFSIKRVSDQPRNPLNAANEQELNYIQQVKETLAKGDKPKPYFDGPSKTGYYPIVTNNFCLQCHGSNIDEETLKTINEKYPKDMAKGYKSNELRGIWVISERD